MYLNGFGSLKPTLRDFSGLTHDARAIDARLRPTREMYRQKRDLVRPPQVLVAGALQRPMRKRADGRNVVMADTTVDHSNAEAAVRVCNKSCTVLADLWPLSVGDR